MRVIITASTNLWREARKRHDCWPTAAAALGLCADNWFNHGRVCRKIKMKS